MPDAAAANRNVFYGKGGARSLVQVYEAFTDKLARNGGTFEGPVTPANRPAPYGLGTGAIPSRGGFVPFVPAAPGGSPTEFATRLFMARLSLPGEAGAIS